MDLRVGGGDAEQTDKTFRAFVVYKNWVFLLELFFLEHVDGRVQVYFVFVYWH